MTVELRARPGEVLAVLRRNPNFARLYASQLVSFGGDWFAMVALQGLVLDLSHSAFLAGLIFAMQLAPAALLSVPAGVVVDRVDRRWLMVATDVVRAVLALGLLLVHSKGTLWVAFASIALISSFTSFFEPASAAVLPNLVREEDLPLANVLSGSTWGTMLAVGAALGGLVAITFGRDAAFIGDAISFGISALLLISVRGNFRVAAHERTTGSMLSDIKELFRFARTESRISSMLFVKAGFGLTAGVIGLIGVMAVDEFGSGDTGTGIMFSTRGLGALVGPFLFRRLFGTEDRALFRAITTAFVVFGIGYCVFGLAPWLWLAALGTCIAHIGGGAQWTFSTIGLQRFSPDRIRGRVFGADYMLVSLTMAISFTATGALANTFGPRPVAVGMSIIGIMWSVGWTLATRRTWPASPETAQGAA